MTTEARLVESLIRFRHAKLSPAASHRMRGVNPRRNRRLRETSRGAHDPVHIDMVAIEIATTIAVAAAAVVEAVVEAAAAAVAVGARKAATGSGTSATMAVTAAQLPTCPGGA